jgi:hypothetical protein
MWEPRPLATLGASKACNRDIFTFLYMLLICVSCTRIWRGRAIADAVSHRLPTAAGRVRAQARSCGICGGQSGSGEGFLRVLRFPLLILIPPTTQHSSSIIRGWYNLAVTGLRTKWTKEDLGMIKTKG